MKRIRIVGLCLVAVFAMSAVVVASASAKPTFKTCIKAEKNGNKEYPTGEFTDKNCSIKGTTLTNKYKLGEWNQGKKVTLKGKNGVSTLDSYIPAKPAEPWTGGTVVGVVTCKSAKSVGNVTGPSTTEVTVEFKSCTSEGKKCTSTSPVGPKEGVIVTKLLESTLEGNGAGKAVSKVGAKGGGNSAEFSCEGLEVKTTGAILGTNSGDVNTFSKSGTTTFSVNVEGGQEPVFDAENPATPNFLLSTITPPGVTLPSGELTTSVQKGENMEIQA